MPRPEDPPTREQCLALMEAHGMRPNIRAHSLEVCRIALAVGRAVAARGVAMNLPLIEAGALLHDITKTRSLETRENHAETGRALLESLGFPETGAIVGEHVIPPDPGNRLTPSEIVAYSDKRVLHDRKVSLDERFVYLLETYGKMPNASQYFAGMRRRMEAIEEKIERLAQRTSDDIIETRRSRQPSTTR